MPEAPHTVVSVDSFVRAETDNYFAGFVATAGIGVLAHRRVPVPIDRQDVVRVNRDTLYSSGVFDLEAGPVTITLPDAASRFMSLQVISEDHYTPFVIYEAGQHTISFDDVGTRYVCTLVRTLVSPDDQDDVAAVHELQDAIEVRQASRGALETPNWDPVSLGIVRDTLKKVAPATGPSTGAFGRADEVDPIRHLVGAATGWGGNPSHDATYVGAYPDRNDGVTAYRLEVRDVPVDGFWSVSVYNEAGYFEPNDEGAYSINNLSAAANADGSITIHFGGDPTAANHLPITKGWNYVARLYRPRAEVIEGRWSFPEPTPID